MRKSSAFSLKRFDGDMVTTGDGTTIATGVGTTAIGVGITATGVGVTITGTAITGATGKWRDFSQRLWAGRDSIPCSLPNGLEGLVSNHRDRPYRSGRCKHWVKVKNRKHPAMVRVMETFA
jgi:hypothetical protein